MDFRDTPEEASFRKEIRDWLEANIPQDWDRSQLSLIPPEDRVEMLRDWQRRLHEGGWAGISWPKAFGGRGGKPIEEAIFGEEQAKWGVSAGIFAVAHGMVGPTLMQHGSREQQALYLAPMLRGEELWCQLFSEPDAGSDLASLSTRAVRDGDEFVVNGQKVWTSNAHGSEWGILIARTDPDAPRHSGITFFVVDMATPGIDVRPLRQMNGEAHFNEVFLNDVRVPAANVVGEVNDGWKVAVTTLSNERVTIAGGSGISDPDRILALARELGMDDNPLFRQKFVSMWMRNEIIRYLRMRSRTALSQGRRPGPEASIMKLAYARYVKQAGNLAVELQGPYGTLLHPHALADGVLQQKFINAVQSSIGGGTDEIQHNIVGERVLGLPREPR